MLSSQLKIFIIPEANIVIIQNRGELIGQAYQISFKDNLESLGFHKCS